MIIKDYWVDLKENLPEEKKFVLVKDEEGNMGVVQYFINGEVVEWWPYDFNSNCCTHGSNDGYLYFNPTHWMPLPSVDARYALVEASAGDDACKQALLKMREMDELKGNT